ncbi:MAG: LptF/LptG family permease [bacterium]|nr:LptF/LptG family permease [bacterium]MDT8366049.1 LptF/LptG family permease [bacterium]
MTLLDRHITRKWILYFFPAVVVLVTVFLASDVAMTFWDNSRRGISPGIVALHYFLKTPYLLYQTAPVASLIATLLTLTGMKRNGEMTAIFTSGTSGVRLSLPIIISALCVSLLSFYLTESVVPGANRISRDLVRKDSGAGASVVGTDRIWLRDGNRVIHIRSVENEGTMLTEPTILQFEDGGLRSLSLRLDAETAHWDKGTWRAEKVFLRRFTDGILIETRVLNNERLPIRTNPDEFQRVRRKPEEMGRAQLKKYIHNLKLAGLPYARYEVNFFQKASAAIISLVFTILSLPVAFIVPVRSGVPMGIGISIFLGAVFWSFYSLSLSLGFASIIPAPIAAWSAQVVFFLLGLAALALIRRPRLH